MKNILLSAIFTVLILPAAAFSQDHFELVKSGAIEEHPGIPGSPVTYTVTYNFIVQDDDITVQAIINDGIEDNIIVSKVFNKGDRFSLQYITKSYPSYDPVIEPIPENPYFTEFEKDVTTLIFPDYDVDRMKTTNSFPVYYVNGSRYDFVLPPIKDEDIQRIYYP